MNISCNEPNMLTRRIRGTIPAVNLFQYTSLRTRYTIPTIMLTRPKNPPTNVASLNPSLVYDVNLTLQHHKE